MSRSLALLAVSMTFAGAMLSRPDAVAARDEPAGLVNRTADGLAIDGYDPVAYVTDGKPVRGDARIEYGWQGTRYRFATAANRDRFASDPARFAPQYGGFCSYAVSRRYTAPVDPEAWSIVGSKLYLNYSKRVQRTWEEDIPGNIRKGDANWPGLRAKGAAGR